MFFLFPICMCVVDFFFLSLFCTSVGRHVIDDTLLLIAVDTFSVWFLLLMVISFGRVDSFSSFIFYQMYFALQLLLNAWMRDAAGLKKKKEEERFNATDFPLY